MTVVGVDLGGTKIAAAVHQGGSVLGPVLQRPTPGQDGPQRVLEVVSSLVTEVAGGGPISAVGVGAAGVINSQTSTVLSSTRVLRDWAGTNIAAGLADRLQLGPDVPIVVCNDMSAHAAGELYHGSARGTDCAVIVGVGTGVGASLIVGGTVHEGSGFVAGEIGHLSSAVARDEECSCGQLGHLEGVASGPALVAAHHREGGTARTAREVVAEASAGDPLAQRVVRRAARALAVAILDICLVVDPELVVLTGGLGLSSGPWAAALHEELSRRAPLASFPPRVTRAELGAAAALVGAAELARRSPRRTQ